MNKLSIALIFGFLIILGAFEVLSNQHSLTSIDYKDDYFEEQLLCSPKERAYLIFPTNPDFGEYTNPRINRNQTFYIVFIVSTGEVVLNYPPELGDPESPIVFHKRFTSWEEYVPTVQKIAPLPLQTTIKIRSTQPGYLYGYYDKTPPTIERLE